MVGEEFKEIYTTKKKYLLLIQRYRKDLIFLVSVKNQQEIYHAGHEPAAFRYPIQ